MSKSNSWYASGYIKRYGFHIVPIEPGRKFPRSANWGNTCLTTPGAAEEYFDKRPDWNMGVALGPSGMGSLDIDCYESFQVICECLGVNLDELIAGTPTIIGRGYRPMFRLPEGVSLPYRKVNWPSRNDPTGDKHKAAMRAAKAAKDAGDYDREKRIRAVAKRWAAFCVFELRSGEGERQRQDVLPPSIHPETVLPYRWVTQPPKNGAPWPEPPAWLLEIWKNFDSYKQQIQSMCPWLPMHDAPEPKRSAKARATYSAGAGAIDAFRQSTSIENELERYGYKRVSRNRWLSPHSSTGLPGVVVYPGSGKCWIHHASDPLCSESSGHPVDAFDLFCYYEHGGDTRAAAHALADRLGVRVSVPAYTAPPAVEIMPVATEQEVGNQARWGLRDTSTPLPWTSERGKPLKHIENIMEICRRLGVIVRYNVIRKEEELVIPGQSFSRDNQANASLAWLKSECSLFGMPTDGIGEFLTYLADKNPFNPVAEWIQSAEWDGVDRLADLQATIRVRNEDACLLAGKLKRVLIKRWLISAVEAAFSHDGVSAEGVLVLQGSQGLGKTRWFKKLVPEDLDLTKDGMLLRPDDKDSVKQVCSYWLVELGELDSTFRRADIAQLKGFITQSMDVMRRPYAQRESHFARRTVFFGSVNPREFLHDRTGNRRYWTLECERINHDHDIDMQQLWAQMLVMRNNGESHRLLPDELDALNAHNDQYLAIDPVEERLLAGLDWDATQDRWRWEQATEILIECGVDRPQRGDALTAASIIRKLNGDVSRRNKGRRQLWCPPRRIDDPYSHF